MKVISGILTAAVIAVLSFAAPSQAALIGGVEFPDGNVSFADSIVSYSPNIASGQPTDSYRGAFNAFGVPDYSGANTCASQAACTFVSLGNGGELVVAFDDNALTGSDNSDLDLWIFEVGPDVEDTHVWISKDGLIWSSVGSVGGSTSGIDIDAFGFTSADLFFYVKLQDFVGVDGTTGATVGADIDAIGAISTTAAVRPGSLPEPAPLAFLGLGLLAMGIRRRLQRRK